MEKNKSRMLKWPEIKYDIELKIINGELKSGDKLPSFTKIMSNYNIALGTAREAFRYLEKEGIIMKPERSSNSQDNSPYYVTPYISTVLKKKHIEDLKGDVNNIISKAKNIKANYEEVKSVCEILESYLNSLDSQNQSL